MPPGSTTKLEKSYFDANFNPFFRIEQVSMADYGRVIWRWERRVIRVS